MKMMELKLFQISRHLFLKMPSSQNFMWREGTVNTGVPAEGGERGQEWGRQPLRGCLLSEGRQEG